MLLRLLQQYVKGKEKLIVGVLGYPNVGKSSVINALKGKGSAPVSPESGFTKGERLVKITKKIYLIDTPGVYPYLERDETKYALIAVVDYSKVKDPETAALKLIRLLQGKVEEYYGVESGKDEMETLENIALKLKRLKKGAVPDTEQTARIILRDWQFGNIRQ